MSSGLYPRKSRSAGRYRTSGVRPLISPQVTLSASPVACLYQLL